MKLRLLPAFPVMWAPPPPRHSKRQRRFATLVASIAQITSSFLSCACLTLALLHGSDIWANVVGFCGAAFSCISGVLLAVLSPMRRTEGLSGVTTVVSLLALAAYAALMPLAASSLNTHIMMYDAELWVTWADAWVLGASTVGVAASLAASACSLALLCSSQHRRGPRRRRNVSARTTLPTPSVIARSPLSTTPRRSKLLPFPLLPAPPSCIRQHQSCSSSQQSPSLSLSSTISTSLPSQPNAPATPPDSPAPSESAYRYNGLDRDIAEEFLRSLERKNSHQSWKTSEDDQLDSWQ